MPSITASAPGKVILFGEHAVVYHRPALAVPVLQVQAKTTISPNITAPQGEVIIEAPDVGLRAELSELPEKHPIAVAIQGVMKQLHVNHLPALTLRITSTIPVASGLGSGAAVTVSIMRALSAFLGHPLTDDQVNSLAYEVEKLYHGNPSGIDNTVITYARPVFYVRDDAIRSLRVNTPFTLVIGDTGVQSPTAVAVGDVRAGWIKDKLTYEAIFDVISRVAYQARNLIECGDPYELGLLMDENHAQLQRLNVSSPELDHLVATARQAGALGAKLSGGGRGGNMIALVRPETSEQVARALSDAGAVRTIVTTIQPEK